MTPVKGVQIQQLLSFIVRKTLTNKVGIALHVFISYIKLFRAASYHIFFIIIARGTGLPNSDVCM